MNYKPARVDFIFMVLNLGSSKGLQKYEANAYNKIIQSETSLVDVGSVDIMSIVYMSNFSINRMNSQ